MCGISGIVSRAPLTPELAERLTRVDEALVHRGPDAEGRLTDRHVALAARRLSIIDRPGGAQPLHNEDRSLALVANGEIYNDMELRHALERRGHRFATRSDCESILHLYEEHGDGCVEHLRGMFAFALWDAPRARLLLARDRMGEKPLYLYETDGWLLFASELRALLASDLVRRELDPEAVNLYFHYGYVPEPWTPVAGVRKLDAAHRLTVDVDPWRVAERCYWRMEDAPPLEGAPEILLREQLDAVGRLTVRAETPIGVALSGGLDSSLVAALAARERGSSVHAISVGYEGRPESDERADAKRWAEHVGLPFHEVELETREVVAGFPRLVCQRDDPIADIAGHGYYAVMRAAKELGVPVMLEGQGGDELFWGYPILREAAAGSRLRARLRERSWGALPDYVRLSSLRTFRRHRRTPGRPIVFYDVSPDYREAEGRLGSFLAPALRERLRTADPDSIWTRVPSENLDVHLTRLICDTYLRENGIAQGDRLSMASSVELRLPLVDHKLVETVIGLRKAQPDSHLPSKSWLQSAVRDLIPPWVLQRPKRGFAPPTRLWHEKIFAAHGESLRDGYLVHAGILSHSGARRLSGGKRPAGAEVPLSFKALVLEQWGRRALSGHG